MAKSKSSRRWLAEHFDDQYVKMAQQQGLRSRAAFKLMELDEKYHLLRKGMRVVDLGSAPGSWTQVVQRVLGDSGQIIALDILPMDPLENVSFIEGDFTEDEPLALLEAELDGHNVDLVLSDMAPNMSGMGAVDQPRAMYLAELALAFSEKWCSSDVTSPMCRSGKSSAASFGMSARFRTISRVPIALVPRSTPTANTNPMAIANSIAPYASGPNVRAR